MLSSKTHVLSIRLSEAEYRHLTETCRAKGVRTVSEVARLILCGLIEDDGSSDAPERLAARISRMDRNLMTLNEEIRALAAMFQAAIVDKRLCSYPHDDKKEEYPVS